MSNHRSAGDGGKKSPITGESAYKPPNSSRREGRLHRLNPWFCTLVRFFILRARLRVQCAPGLSCALSTRERITRSKARAIPVARTRALEFFVVPAEAGTHTPQRGDVAGTAIIETLGGYGSPPPRGRQRPGLRQERLSALDSRLRGNERSCSLLREPVANSPSD